MRFAVIPFFATAVASMMIAGVAEAVTIVTKYSYNADGALTAVAKQVEPGEPQTTYLTWDNFVPEASDPTRGQVLNSNGRLAAIGPAPGLDGATEVFGFDVAIA
jgi:ApbE superfamily uncharacterized protein (UPF0280 family)